MHQIHKVNMQQNILNFQFEPLRQKTLQTGVLAGCSAKSHQKFLVNNIRETKLDNEENTHVNSPKDLVQDKTVQNFQKLNTQDTNRRKNGHKQIDNRRDRNKQHAAGAMPQVIKEKRQILGCNDNIAQMETPTR